MVGGAGGGGAPSIEGGGAGGGGGWYTEGGGAGGGGAPGMEGGGGGPGGVPAPNCWEACGGPFTPIGKPDETGEKGTEIDFRHCNSHRAKHYSTMSPKILAIHTSHQHLEERDAG